MAFKKSRVERKPELEEVVKRMKNKFSVAFAEIQPGRIFYLESDGKSKRAVKLASIKVPHPDLTPYRFALTVYSQLWNDLDEAHQLIYLERELLRIIDFEEGKMSGYPINDFPFILQKFGINWEDKEDLPNILEDDKEVVDEDINEDRDILEE